MIVDTVSSGRSGIGLGTAMNSHRGNENKANFYLVRYYVTGVKWEYYRNILYTDSYCVSDTTSFNITIVLCVINFSTRTDHLQVCEHCAHKSGFKALKI